MPNILPPWESLCMRRLLILVLQWPRPSMPCKFAVARVGREKQSAIHLCFRYLLYTLLLCSYCSCPAAHDMLLRRPAPRESLPTLTLRFLLHSVNLVVMNVLSLRRSHSVCYFTSQLPESIGALGDYQNWNGTSVLIRFGSVENRSGRV